MGGVLCQAPLGVALALSTSDRHPGTACGDICGIVLLAVRVDTEEELLSVLRCELVSSGLWVALPIRQVHTWRCLPPGQPLSGLTSFLIIYY